MKLIKPLVYSFILIILVIQFNGCKQVAFTAPDGSTLIVTINPAVISPGDEAQVKVLGYKANGSLIPDGTVIFFSCDIGSIDPSAETLGGIAYATFRSNDGVLGTATIRITSGNVDTTKESHQVQISTPELASLWITANPISFDPGGGTANIMVTAYDYDMQPLADVPVVIKSDNGTLEHLGEILFTDSNGQVTDTLETDSSATVTAVSGAVTSSVKITVKANEQPVADFIFSPLDPLVGEKVYFNASGSSDDGTIVSYKWDFGDGSTANGERVGHIYRSAGSYVVLLTVTDNLGEKEQKSTTVTIKLPGTL